MIEDTSSGGSRRGGEPLRNDDDGDDDGNVGEVASTSNRINSSFLLFP
jgi:hypothetical protein